MTIWNLTLLVLYDVMVLLVYILVHATEGFTLKQTFKSKTFYITAIPRLTKIIRSGITFVSRNLHYPKREKISSWNGPTVQVCCFMLARASTKTFVSQIHIR